MKKTHYYLVDTSVVTPGAAVSDLQFKIISEEPFGVHDIKVRHKYTVFILLFFWLYVHYIFLCSFAQLE